MKRVECVFWSRECFSDVFFSMLIIIKLSQKSKYIQVLRYHCLAKTDMLCEYLINSTWVFLPMKGRKKKSRIYAQRSPTRDDLYVLNIRNKEF